MTTMTEDEDEHEHHHHHDHDDHDEHCCCGHHHHHHDHDADEVFTSWGVETAKKFSKLTLSTPSPSWIPAITA